MNLVPGNKLGSYQILAAIGAGGMGQVFHARDTKLGREVALKVLPDDVARDPERLRRFEREASTLAALNPLHIAQIYGFEDSGPVCALVMELVPGESLAARLRSGPVPVRETLELARQIAEGLAAARDKGIIHRDLKPANLQVTPEGAVKILDFGLAKALAPPGVDAADGAPADDVTTRTATTRHGMILGTAGYMSPEQARGLPVDARADVWAFGNVLYELLSGTRPFAGATTTDVLAAVLERDPDWTALPPATPATIRALLRRCLQKDPRQRLHHIADARFTIEDALAAFASTQSGVAIDGGGPGTRDANHPPRAVWRHPLPLSLGFAALVLASALAWSVNRTPTPAPHEPQHLSLVLPPDQELVPGGVAISPDGRDLVYSASAEEGPPGPEGNVVRLFHRRLTEAAARVLPGADYVWSPTFSPDGAWVAFYSRADQQIKKIVLSGGSAVPLADAPWIAWGATLNWSEPGHILFADDFGPVRRVPASGGQAEIVVPRSALRPPSEQGTETALPLPGEAGVLFKPRAGGNANAPAIWARGQRRDLPLTRVRFLALFGPYLLGWRTSQTANDLVVAPFDRDRGEVTGEAVALLSEEGVGGSTHPIQLSDTGTLVSPAVRSAVRRSRRRGWRWGRGICRRPSPTGWRGA